MLISVGEWADRGYLGEKPVAFFAWWTAQKKTEANARALALAVRATEAEKAAHKESALRKLTAAEKAALGLEK